MSHFAQADDFNRSANQRLKCSNSKSIQISVYEWPRCRGATVLMMMMMIIINIIITKVH